MQALFFAVLLSSVVVVEKVFWVGCGRLVFREGGGHSALHLREVLLDIERMNRWSRKDEQYRGQLSMDVCRQSRAAFEPSGAWYLAMISSGETELETELWAPWFSDKLVVVVAVSVLVWLLFVVVCVDKSFSALFEMDSTRSSYSSLPGKVPLNRGLTAEVQVCHALLFHSGGRRYRYNCLQSVVSHQSDL